VHSQCIRPPDLERSRRPWRTQGLSGAGRIHRFLPFGGLEFFSGVAFAPDGDPLVDFCGFSGSPLRRFDRQGVEAPDATGSELHPSTLLPSDAGCGLTNHPDGTLYSNTGNGVTNLDASTGAVLRSGYGPAGNALVLYDRALTAAEVTALFARGTP